MPSIFLAPSKSGGGTKRIKTASPFAPVIVIAKNHISRTPLLSRKIKRNYHLINALKDFFKREFENMEILGKSTIIGDQALPSFWAYPVQAKIFEDKENAQLLIALKFKAMGKPYDLYTEGEKLEALDNAAKELLGKLNICVKKLDMKEARIEHEDKRIKWSVEELDQSEITLWHLGDRKSYHYVFAINLPQKPLRISPKK